MKKFFAFTTMTLFAITCLFLTSLYADYEGWDDGYAGVPFQNVYGYVYVTVTYDAETSTANSYHHFFLNNGGNVPVSYSYTFAAEVTGPDGEEIAADRKEDGGQVPVNREELDSHDFPFDMEGQDGELTISGSSDLSITADFDHNGMPDPGAWDSWSASASIEFEAE